MKHVEEQEEAEQDDSRESGISSNSNVAQPIGLMAALNLENADVEPLPELVSRSGRRIRRTANANASYEYDVDKAAM